MFERRRLPLSLTSLVAALSAYGVSPASARCLPASLLSAIYVGDTAHDRNCGFNNIQAAIDAAVCPGATVIVTSELTYTNQALSIAGKSLSIVGGGTRCGSVIATLPTSTTVLSARTASLSLESAPVSTGPVATAPLSTAPVTAAPAASPPTQITLRGVGSGGDSPVIGVSGNSHVTLRNLNLTGGNVPLNEFGGYGGGVSFFGTGVLTLDNVTVSRNYAGYGGGIDVTATGGAAELHLGDNVLVVGNTAQFDGGGVRVDGNTRLFMLGANSGVVLNQALGANGHGYGGGIEVVGPARADIGSPGYFGLGAIYGNDAVNGGGLAVVAGAGDASARLFSVDGAHPVHVQSNSASQNGGGVLVKPFNDGSSPAFGMASLCAGDFRISDNIAQDGAGLYADVDTAPGGTTPWSSVVFNRPSTAQSICTFPEAPSALGGVPCAPGVVCNSIDANATLAPSGAAVPGSTVLVQNGSFLYADRFRMNANQSAHALRANTGPGRLELGDCLLYRNLGGSFANNQGGGEVVFTGTETVIDGCTFSLNSVGNNGPVIRASSSLTLERSILDQHEVSNLVYTGSPSNLIVSYVMAITSVGIPAGPTVLFGQDPQLVSYASDDYHLQPTSPALDFAPTFALDGTTDLDGLSRNQDLPGVTNRFGTRDLGAYERQP